MAKRHYIPVTADVPGVNDSQRAFIRKVIRTALVAEGVDFPCEVDVLLTNDEAIHQINLDMREVDRATDVLSFPEFDLQPGELPGRGGRRPRHRGDWCPWSTGGYGDLHGSARGGWAGEGPQKIGCGQERKPFWRTGDPFATAGKLAYLWWFILQYADG